MDKWTADFTNNPFDDYSLIVEILYNDDDVAVIKNGEKGLELKLYPTEEELTIPLDWLTGLFSEAQKQLSNR